MIKTLNDKDAVVDLDRAKVAADGAGCGEQRKGGGGPCA